MMLSLALGGSILLTTPGCALLTAQSVGTFVATEVGKEAGKKVVKDMKDDHDEKKAAEQQQNAGPSEQAQSKSDSP